MLWLCLSVTSRYCIKTAEEIELISSVEATLHLSCIVLEENLGVSKMKVLLSGTLP